MRSVCTKEGCGYVGVICTRVGCGYEKCVLKRGVAMRCGVY